VTPEQLEKRRRIMKRSMALGHCVCNPKKPCPCDTFRDMNVCECAGERIPPRDGPVRLTEHVRNTGCSSKIGKRDLHAALAGLPEIDDPRVLVGSSAGDDAGVIMLSGDEATVLTVDVFSPSVDDPYTFGQIAAANSVSDIYAMGARPDVALSIIGFPIHTLSPEVMREILRGGIDKMREAGVPVIGGHSINDEEVKCGFAVVGRAPREELVRNDGARVGDAIVLTKPLGIGIVTFAHQIGRAPEGALDAAAKSMAQLNRLAAERMVARGVHAGTDVTGFSLLGHMAEIVSNSGVEVELDFDAIPIFEGVATLARQEVLPGAVERNRESVAPEILDLSALAPAQESILFCPETSGGLLVFLAQDEADDYVNELRAGGVTAANVIGRVSAVHAGGLIRATTSCAAEFAPLAVTPVAASASAPKADLACCADGPPSDSGAASSCCADAPKPDASASEQGQTQPVAAAGDAFKTYMRTVMGPGALGAKEKKLIALALSIMTKCEPCVKIHTKGARDADASDAEVAEAAAIAISFGGAPVGMFYNMLGKSH
jgi:selenide,water dikinase